MGGAAERQRQQEPSNQLGFDFTRPPPPPPPPPRSERRSYWKGTLPGHARNSDTSREAAEALLPRLAEGQLLVLEALRRLGPSTGHELGVHLGLETYLVLPRLTNLRYQGEVEDTGLRRPNPKSGRNATVWRAVRQDPHA